MSKSIKECVTLQSYLNPNDKQQQELLAAAANAISQENNKNNNNSGGAPWSLLCHLTAMTKITALGAFLGLGTTLAAKNIYSAFTEGGPVCYTDTSIAATVQQEQLSKDTDIQGIAVAMGIGALALIQGTFTVEAMKKLYGNLYAECNNSVNTNVSSLLSKLFAKGNGTAELPEWLEKFILPEHKHFLEAKNTNRHATRPRRYSQYATNADGDPLFIDPRVFSQGSPGGKSKSRNKRIKRNTRRRKNFHTWF